MRGQREHDINVARKERADSIGWADYYSDRIRTNDREISRRLDKIEKKITLLEQQPPDQERTGLVADQREVLESGRARRDYLDQREVPTLQQEAMVLLDRILAIVEREGTTGINKSWTRDREMSVVIGDLDVTESRERLSSSCQRSPSTSHWQWCIS